MVLVVDIRHWLLPNGDPDPRLRRQVLRHAPLIEYGATLSPGYTRETLVECSHRPGRKPCPGLLWVFKLDDGTIEATCVVCKDQQIFISGWEETTWAEGPMEPVPVPTMNAVKTS
jgi:hypothetical protein